jgi:hypothetical protein
MHIRWSAALVAALLIPFAVWQGQSQETAPASPPQSSSSSSSKDKNQRYSHANDFLIRGTVFTEKALAFPDVQLRIRRSGEKKFRWEDRTNSRGEFAIRVPQGIQYEMVAHAKDFADQIRTIDARNGAGENNVVFRMEPAKKGKK